MEGATKHDTGKIQWSLLPYPFFQFMMDADYEEIRYISNRLSVLTFSVDTGIIADVVGTLCSEYTTWEETVRVLEFGANKYSRDNWMKGIKWSRLLDAAMRHWTKRGTKDEESGLDHAAHCAVNLMMLYWMVHNRTDLDDLLRPGCDYKA